MMSASTIFDRSVPGRTGCELPECDVGGPDAAELIPASQLASEPPDLPSLGELDVVRHFTRLSQKNMGVDSTFYPLGSCTMKYNPKVSEAAASLPGFLALHPCQPERTVQGVLQVLHELERYLAEIAGLDAVSLQPCAGAHGELTSLMVITARHRKKGEDRGTILIPDSAHGTNPASTTLCGCRAVQVKSGSNGLVDLADLKDKLDDKVAALMITNPNTLGLFESDIVEIAKMVHDAGALLYLDGANMNAILGVARPGDFGVDVMHYNPHKTFGTPHGAGGPGAGPIAVTSELEPFLPVPRIRKDGEGYRLDYDVPDSIGRVRSFYGNVAVLVRAYAYIRLLGPEGLRNVAETAVLNANYLLALLKDAYKMPHGDRCMHEFVLSAARQKSQGVKALDIAKRLLDFGFHPPTIYFPLIVPEAMMIEPTETESKETLDAFAEAMLQIAKEAEETPQVVLDAPHRQPVRRIDEVKAARELDLRAY